MQEDAPWHLPAVTEGSVPAVESAGVAGRTSSLEMQQPTEAEDPQLPQPEDRNPSEGLGSSSPVRREKPSRADDARFLSAGGGRGVPRSSPSLARLLSFRPFLHTSESLGGWGQLAKAEVTPSISLEEFALQSIKRISLSGPLGVYDSSESDKGYDAYKLPGIYGDLRNEERSVSDVRVRRNYLLRPPTPEVHPGSSSEEDSGLQTQTLPPPRHHLPSDRVSHGLLGDIVESKKAERKTSKGMFSAQASESPLFAEKGQHRKTTSPADSGESVFCFQCPREDLPENITPNVVWDSQRNHEYYRLCSLEAGSFKCCFTDLIFEVTAGVTIKYHFDSWHKHLNGRDAQKWSVAGPLINIQADPVEAVAAVHFPHFLCLADEDSSQVYIGHFVEEGMSLEKPNRVGSWHAVLRNPKFSPRGVVFKKPWFRRKIKVHCIALLYQVLEVPAQKFHLYLLPNDSSLRKTVHEKEVTCPSCRVDKPSVVLNPLRIGSRFFVQKLDDVTICPKELELQYLHADMEQQYLELYAEHKKDKFHFRLIEKKKNELIWEAFVRQEELKSSDSTEEASPLKQHFIEQHREELIQRTTNIEAVLDMLLGTILNNEQYQMIASRGTNQEKMRELYMLVPSWNHYCKDLLYKALKTRNRYLIADLEGK